MRIEGALWAVVSAAASSMDFPLRALVGLVGPWKLLGEGRRRRREGEEEESEIRNFCHGFLTARY